MSADATMSTPKARKSKTPKDKSTHKSSKKRAHEEAEAEASTPAVAEPSPSKKPRTETTTTSPTATPSTALTPTDLETHTPFVRQTTSLYLALSPVAYNYPIQGLCAEHLSPYLISYYPPLAGILLSYTNPRLSTTADNVPSSVPDNVSPNDAPIVLAQSIDEYGVSFAWLTAEFLLLKPVRGTVIEAQVRVQNPSYLGLVCWNFFGASVERRRLPGDWRWVAAEVGDVDAAEGDEEAAAAETGEGHWVDGRGEKVEGLVKFTVRDFESAPMTERERGFVNIEGTLLGPDEDRKIDEEIREKMRDRNKSRKGGRR
ncbi:hypothetical protein MBLNU457_g0231t1 [Dothideomycetes sp. NU457]